MVCGSLDWISGHDCGLQALLGVDKWHNRVRFCTVSFCQDYIGSEESSQTLWQRGIEISTGKARPAIRRMQSKGIQGDPRGSKGIQGNVGDLCAANPTLEILHLQTWMCPKMGYPWIPPHFAHGFLIIFPKKIAMLEAQKPHFWANPAGFSLRQERSKSPKSTGIWISSKHL